jgi:hypothetical protein
MSEEEIYEEAKKRVKAKRDFYGHLTAYIIVNAILVLGLGLPRWPWLPLVPVAARRLGYRHPHQLSQRVRLPDQARKGRCGAGSGQDQERAELVRIWGLVSRRPGDKPREESTVSATRR